MAKQFGYTASILRDTNRLVASSQADWSSLKTGSYVIFDEDEDFYKVVDKKRFFYIKDFEVISPNKISIEGSTDIKLSLNDDTTLTFKEYKVSSVKVLNGGSGFSKGEVVEINKGIYKINSYDGLPYSAKVLVESVGTSGDVTSVSISNPGVYYEAPNSSLSLDKSLNLELEYDLVEDRTRESRSISEVFFDGEKTILSLNNDLPLNVKMGKVSVDKWELILNINYVAASKINSHYRVLVDFTPHLGLPLMRGDLNKNVAIFNESITKIDGEIKKIWAKLGT